MNSNLNKTYQRPVEIKVNALATDFHDTYHDKLHVLYPSRRDKTHLYWLAVCECGTEVEVRAHQLVNGVVGSCGKCEQVPHMRAASRPLEIPYTINGVEVPHQHELDLTAPTTPDAAEMAAIMGEDDTVPDVVKKIAGETRLRLEVPDTEVEVELDALRQCCAGFDAAPQAAHKRMFKYLRSRYEEK